MDHHAHLSRRDAALYVTTDEGRVERVRIGERRIIVGSDVRCDICLVGSSVRPRHASICFASGDHVLSTVSEGTTLVNGVPVKERTLLNNGDVIWIGGQELRFVRLQDVSATSLQLSICRRNEPHDILLTQRPELRIGHRVGEVRISDEFLSDPHCVIENPFPGLLFVVNRDAVRGTKLNGVRLIDREPLKDGDVLTLGTTTIHVNVLVGLAMPIPGGSIAGMAQAVQPALRLPEVTDWDAPGVTQLLDMAQIEAADAERRRGAHDETTWDGPLHQPYYLPKGTFRQRSKHRYEPSDASGFYEGITREIPKATRRGAGRPRYYLPEDER